MLKYNFIWIVGIGRVIVQVIDGPEVETATEVEEDLETGAAVIGIGIQKVAMGIR